MVNGFVAPDTQNVPGLIKPVGINIEVGIKQNPIGVIEAVQPGLATTLLKLPELNLKQICEKHFDFVLLPCTS